MRLKTLRVKNFRTFEQEQQLHLEKGLAIVGPNNTGKTNLLHAVQLLFTGYDNTFGYTRERDLPFNLKREKTSLTAQFSLSSSTADTKIVSQYREVCDLIGTSIEGLDEIRLNVYFTDSSNPVYRFFPNTARPKGTDGSRLSRAEKDLVESLIRSFSLHYVPSNKSFRDLYNSLVVPALRKQITRALQAHLPVIANELKTTSDSVSDALAAAGLDNYTARIALPAVDSRSFLGSFDLSLLDPNETSVFSKGMGVQAAAILACMQWVSGQESEEGLQPLWLLEEPEAFLHPGLATNCMNQLTALRESSQLVWTTHSLKFVPADASLVVGTSLEGERTKIVTYNTFLEATRCIRDALGVRFSDFLNLSGYNIFVEGKTDIGYIRGVLEALSPQDYPYPILRSDDLLVEEFGGVKQLGGFVRANWRHIAKEVAAVVLFDGDVAGVKERRALTGYLSNTNVRFQSNQDYVTVKRGHPIEALFPDDWVIQLHGSNPGWFQEFSQDSQNQLEDFVLRDDAKTRFQDRMLSWAQESDASEWAAEWVRLLDTLETALSNSAMRLRK